MTILHTLRIYKKLLLWYNTYIGGDIIGKNVDLTGQKFGKLTVVELLQERKNGKKYYNCLCECGNYIKLRSTDLRNKKRDSCGCAGRAGAPKKIWKWHNKDYTIDELCNLANRSKGSFYNLIKQGWTIDQIVNNKPIHHGMKGTRLYRIYYKMLTRCYNKNDNEHYKYYGDRGIKVCDEWLNDNKTFFDWAINNGYQDNLTLDRIDNDGNYTPDNCRWISTYEQNKNRTNSIMIQYQGKKHSITEWIKMLNLTVDYQTINNRLLNYGWNIEEAFYTPKHEYKCKEKVIENKLRKWLADHGIYALGVLKQNKKANDIGYHQKVFNGGYMCTAGVCDLAITIHGVDIRIECKQETGLLSVQQKHILKQILNSGGYGFILKPSNYDDVVCFLNAIIEHDDETRNAMYQVLASQTYCLINKRDRK